MCCNQTMLSNAKTKDKSIMKLDQQETYAQSISIFTLHTFSFHKITELRPKFMYFPSGTVNRSMAHDNIIISLYNIIAYITNIHKRH